MAELSAAVLGLGESLAHYDGKGIRFGVNEIFKYHYVDYLLLINPPNRHTPEENEIIRNSKPKYVVTHYPFSWLRHWMPAANVDKIKASLKHKELYFQDGRKVRFAPWKGKFEADRVYHSLTSPFVAISLAFYLGFRDIVLWGVDFKTHGSYPIGSNGHHTEMENYKQLIAAIRERGGAVRHGIPEQSLIEI